MSPIDLFLAFALLITVSLLIREREKRARLDTKADALEIELATARSERPELDGFKGSIDGLSAAVCRADDRESHTQAMLSSLETQVHQGSERIAGLVGRWSNPKSRSQLGEAWLVGALRRMGLNEGTQFETQKRVVTVGRRGRREGVIDVLLYLPSGDGLVLDSKFPWSPHLQEVMEGPEDARDFALRKLRDALRSHIKDIAGREYPCAEGVTVRHVLVVVPDWQTLELVKSTDSQIGQFAAELGVGLLPADGMYEIAAALGELHREEGWGEKIRELFAPEDADRMYNACRDLLGRLEMAVKRHNSSGDALTAVVAAFSPNGLMGREVLAPASRAAEKIALESDLEVKRVDEEKPARHEERLRDRQKGSAASTDHMEAA